MSRRHRAVKREQQIDAQYGSAQIAKFINALMKHGKKEVAEKVMYGALHRLGEAAEGADALEAFQSAIKNVFPSLEVKSRRVGGSTYQIPVEVRDERRLSLAIRWLIEASRKRSEKSMDAALAGELLDAFHNRGTAVKKKEDTHKMAEANRAFAHYMW